VREKNYLTYIICAFLCCYSICYLPFFLPQNEWMRTPGWRLGWRDCCFVGLAHGIYWTITYLNRLTFSNLFTCKTWSQMVRYWWRVEEMVFFQFSKIHPRMNGWKIKVTSGFEILLLIHYWIGKRHSKMKSSFCCAIRLSKCYFTLNVVITNLREKIVFSRIWLAPIKLSSKQCFFATKNQFAVEKNLCKNGNFIIVLTYNLFQFQFFLYL